MRKRRVNLMIISMLYSVFILLPHMTFADEVITPTELTIECDKTALEYGKTTVNITETAAEFFMMIDDAPLASGSPIPGDAIAFSSGDTFFVHAGEYIHVWARTVGGEMAISGPLEDMVANGYGEHIVLEAEIEPIPDQAIPCYDDVGADHYGSSRITLDSYTGRAHILINDVSIPWYQASPELSLNTVELTDGTGVYAVDVGDYVHIWTTDVDVNNVYTYGEHQMTADDIGLFPEGDQVVVDIEPDRKFSDSVTLKFSDIPAGYYYFYYIIEATSTLDLPAPVDGTAVMANMDSIINDGVADATLSYGYIQTDLLTNGIYAIIDESTAHSNIKASTNYILYVAVSKGNGSASNLDRASINFTTNAEIYASAEAPLVEFVDDDASDINTQFKDLNEFPIQNTFKWSVDANAISANPIKGHYLDGTWADIEDGDKLEILNGTQVAIAEVNNNDQAIKYVVLNAVTEIELDLAPPLSGGLSFEDDLDTTNLTVVNVDPATDGDKYIYKKFSDENSIPDIEVDELSTEWTGWTDLPETNKVMSNHDYYIVVVKVNSEFRVLQTSYGQAVVLKIPLLVNGLTFIDDDTDNVSTLIQLGAPSAPGNTFRYKSYGDGSGMIIPEADDVMVGFLPIEHGDAIDTTINGVLLGVVEVYELTGSYYAVQFSNGLSVVDLDITEALNNSILLYDNYLDDVSTKLTMTGSTAGKHFAYKVLGENPGTMLGMNTVLDETWITIDGDMVFETTDGYYIAVAEYTESGSDRLATRYGEGQAVVSVSITPELEFAAYFEDDDDNDTGTILCLNDPDSDSKYYVYNTVNGGEPMTHPRIGVNAGAWPTIEDGQSIDMANDKYVGILEVDSNNAAIRFSNVLTVTEVESDIPLDDEVPNTKPSSSTNNTPKTTPDDPPIIPEEPTMPPSNEALDLVGDQLDQVQTPEEAQEGVDTISETLLNIDPEKLSEEGDEKRELLDRINRLIDSAGEMMDKMAPGADKGAVAKQIIENTEAIVKEMAQSEAFSQGNKEKIELGNKLVELANKAIEEESKVLVDGGPGLIMPESVAGSLENSKALKDKLEETLNKVGIDQSLKSVKQSLVVKVNDDDKKQKIIGFHRSALEQLAEQVDEVILDFGGTEINIDKKDLENAKENLYFTKEDQDDQIGKDGEKVREINAYRGSEKVKEFEEPVKVTLKVADFGFGDATPEELNALIVMVQNEATGVWEPNGGVYDPVTKTIALYRIHMSKYTVVKNKKKFTDVGNSDAKETINNMLGKGIVNAGDSFKPDESISREEFASWISRAYGLKTEEDNIVFEDVDKSNPYYNEIANAAKHGLVFGRSDTEFSPKDKITREEMATLVARAVSNYNDTKVPDTGAKRFASLENDESISGWAVDNVAMAIDMGIMNTDENGDFNPSEFITKEQAAEVFSKVYK